MASPITTRVLIGLLVVVGAAYIFARNQGGPGNWGLVPTRPECLCGSRQ